MVGWLGIGCGIPVWTFASKFGLFKSPPPAVDSLGNPVETANVSLNGWGILCIVLVGSYLMTIVKEVADARPGYSFTKQCYKGLSSLIPLIVIYGVCHFLRGSLDQVLFCLAVVIACRAVAIPLNPLPKWKYETKGYEDYSDLLGSLTKFVKSRRKGGGNE